MELVPLWVGLGLAVWTDVTTRRIPNALNLTLAVTGLVMAIGGVGRVAPLDALSAMGLAFAVMAVPFAVHIYKGGDLKLVVAASAWLTPAEALWAILAGIVLGGLLGLMQTGFRRQGLRQLWTAIYVAVASRELPPAEAAGGTQGTVPMAVAFAGGILLTIYGVFT